MKDIQIQTKLTTTFNVVVEDDDKETILRKALELLNDNVFGIEFDIKSVKVVGKSPKDFDSTV
jgi:hypothetical protein|tara:strand:- start:145 stop:333 length:189 start_codon:yes stop_codon:yes gene_type:complete